MKWTLISQTTLCGICVMIPWLAKTQTNGGEYAKIQNIHNLTVGAKLWKTTDSSFNDLVYLSPNEVKTTKIPVRYSDRKNFAVRFFYDSISYRSDISYAVTQVREEKDFRIRVQEIFKKIDDQFTNGMAGIIASMGFEFSGQKSADKNIHDWVIENLNKMHIEGLEGFLNRNISLQQLTLVALVARRYAASFGMKEVEDRLVSAVETFDKGYSRTVKYKEHVPVGFSVEVEGSFPLKGGISYLSSKNADHSTINFFNSSSATRPFNFKLLLTERENNQSYSVYLPLFVNKSALIYSSDSNSVFKPNQAYNFLNAGIGFGIIFKSTTINLPKRKSTKLGIMMDIGLSKMFRKEHFYTRSNNDLDVKNSTSWENFGKLRANLHVGPFLDFHYFKLKTDFFVTPKLTSDKNALTWTSLNVGLVVPIYSRKFFIIK